MSEHEPQTSGSVQVRTMFERFVNWTVASLITSKAGGSWLQSWLIISAMAAQIS